jgi:hypothetical protein
MPRANNSGAKNPTDAGTASVKIRFLKRSLTVADERMPNGLELSGPAKSLSHYRAELAGSAPASG